LFALALGDADSVGAGGFDADADHPGNGPNIDAVEPDNRRLEWAALRRLALLDGVFIAPYQPISAGEIRRLAGGARNDAKGLWSWDSCSCAAVPLHAHVGGRLALHELGPGGQITGEAGLRGRGLLLALEPDLTLAGGVFWVAISPRLTGPLATNRSALPAALTYQDWPPPAGPYAAGLARREDPPWQLTLPRAVIGASLGRWAITAGVFPAVVGIGLDGDGLTLTSHAASLPQLVARRTSPFAWSGVLRPLAPSHLLVRAGWTSAQTVQYRDEWGRHERCATPLFCQWLLAWNHTSWWRTTVAHAALAAPRTGESLWADLLQINFPRLGTTWNEVERGPITDRLFSLGMEWRFRTAPWPVLPSAAGRLWWEYGGEDFRPHDTLPLLPEIAAPASLAGVELLDEYWDVGLQYLQTWHSSVLWYSNQGFTEAYTNDHVVLGHPLGGGAKAWTAVVRVRTGQARTEWELRTRLARWERTRGLPVSAELREWTLSWRHAAAPARSGWQLRAGWTRETTGLARADWLVAQIVRDF
jgi:hypothetical protein